MRLKDSGHVLNWLTAELSRAAKRRLLERIFMWLSMIFAVHSEDRSRRVILAVHT